MLFQVRRAAGAGGDAHIATARRKAARCRAAGVVAAWCQVAVHCLPKGQGTGVGRMVRAVPVEGVAEGLFAGMPTALIKLCARRH